uniref:Metalloendopeptidase n=1 Tax=Strongyloides papillosus TaxID=174720 RepID=A0A0N5BIQ5_STREA
MRCKIIISLLILKLIYVSTYKINSLSIDSNEDIRKEINDLNTLETNNRKKRKIRRDISYKWRMPIPYTVIEPVNSFTVDTALQAISKETCINFTKRSFLNYVTPGILYTFTGQCESFIGKLVNYGWQGIEIGRHCEYPGLFHEQCRFDRDEHIKLRQSNMDENGLRNCYKVGFADYQTYNLNYDLGSIMHYGTYAFSKNDKRTLVAHDPHYFKTYGQTERLSFIDIKTLNYHYCSDVCPHKIPCSNQGFQDSKNCLACRCPEGFGGTHCEEVARQRRGCRKAVIWVADKVININFKSKRNCFIHLKTVKGREIIIKLVKLHMHPINYRFCSFNNSLEINYQVDKSVSGARFCAEDHNRLMISYNEHVIVYYRSQGSGNFAHLIAKSIKQRKRQFQVIE